MIKYRGQKRDSSVPRGDLDGKLALCEVQAEILHNFSVLAVDAAPGYIARQLTEMSLEERLIYLADFRRAAAGKLREIGNPVDIKNVMELFIEYMNEREFTSNSPLLAKLIKANRDTRI